jgi:hypothetical protein
MLDATDGRQSASIRDLPLLRLRSIPGARDTQRWSCINNSLGLCSGVGFHHHGGFVGNQADAQGKA